MVNKIKSSNKGKVLISSEELENLRRENINKATVEALADALQDKLSDIVQDIEEKKDEIESIKDEVSGC